MIVKNKDFGWELIHQQAHGLLAVKIAMHWDPAKRSKRWIETLVALTEHDDGQEPWEDTNHLTSAGAPMDFRIEEYSVGQAKRMIEIALEKSRWNALMVSLHATFLYSALAHKNEELARFLDDQQQNQKQWIKQMKLDRKEVDFAYAFVQWCDALSLILCQGHLPENGRRLEISPGPDGISYYIYQRSDESVGVDPWPFDSPEFTIEVEAYQLHQLRFKNDTELYECIQQAPVEEKVWKFRQE
ncbi:hypothetical protein GCM10028803_06290 [Larkinella knui]|uniref:DUF3891 family protein n=1 Tax=Larkinella knui TaxID=2025310 RepID=A0A3P1CKU3_9BACT|nr:DUF3891 family protein [Larkinella knui]RRB13696.1 DUF3891 family protein [Larkinella knui]